MFTFTPHTRNRLWMASSFGKQQGGVVVCVIGDPITAPIAVATCEMEAGEAKT